MFPFEERVLLTEHYKDKIRDAIAKFRARDKGIFRILRTPNSIIDNLVCAFEENVDLSKELETLEESIDQDKPIITTGIRIRVVFYYTIWLAYIFLTNDSEVLHKHSPYRLLWTILREKDRYEKFMEDHRSDIAMSALIASKISNLMRESNAVTEMIFIIGRLSAPHIIRWVEQIISRFDMSLRLCDILDKVDEAESQILEAFSMAEMSRVALCNLIEAIKEKLATLTDKLAEIDQNIDKMRKFALRKTLHLVMERFERYYLMDETEWNKLLNEDVKIGAGTYKASMVAHYSYITEYATEIESLSKHTLIKTALSICTGMSVMEVSNDYEFTDDDNIVAVMRSTNDAALIIDTYKRLSEGMLFLHKENRAQIPTKSIPAAEVRVPKQCVVAKKAKVIRTSHLFKEQRERPTYEGCEPKLEDIPEPKLENVPEPKATPESSTTGSRSAKRRKSKNARLLESREIKKEEEAQSEVANEIINELIAETVEQLFEELKVVPSKIGNGKYDLSKLVSAPAYKPEGPLKYKPTILPVRGQFQRISESIPRVVSYLVPSREAGRYLGIANYYLPSGFSFEYRDVMPITALI